MHVLHIFPSTSATPPISEQAWLMDGDTLPQNVTGIVGAFSPEVVVEVKQHQGRAVNHVQRLKDGWEARLAAAQKVAAG